MELQRKVSFDLCVWGRGGGVRGGSGNYHYHLDMKWNLISDSCIVFGCYPMEKWQWKLKKCVVDVRAPVITCNITIKHNNETGFSGAYVQAGNWRNLLIACFGLSDNDSLCLSPNLAYRLWTEETCWRLALLCLMMILCVCLPAGGAEGRPVAVSLSAGTVPEDAQRLRRFLGDGRRQAEDRIHLSPWLASSPAAAQRSQGGFVSVFFVGHPCSVRLLLASVDWGLWIELEVSQSTPSHRLLWITDWTQSGSEIPSHRLLWITDWTQSGSEHPICFGNCPGRGEEYSKRVWWGYFNQSAWAEGVSRRLLWAEAFFWQNLVLGGLSRK